MYQEFYGLRELPFELTPNTSYLFLPALQREALSTLQYGLSAAKPITLLIGDAGTGKTTLIRAALESDRCRDVRCIYLNNPLLTQEDFVRILAVRFGLTPAAAESKAVLLQELEERLLEQRARGRITALIVDEAQSLTPALLEEIRLLANIETETQKLLPLVLAGQPELAARLEDPGLRQLKQRITLRCELKPFELADTAAYISRRIAQAGGTPAQLFTRQAITLVHDHSGGIARTINVICDNALVTGMAVARQPVDSAIVSEVCRDLALPRRVPAAAPPGDAAETRPTHDPGLAAGASVSAPPEEPEQPARRTFRSWLRRRMDSRPIGVVIE